MVKQAGNAIDENIFDRNPEDVEERIRQIAYGLWEEEGKPEGRAGEHWREAENRARIDGYTTRTPQEALELDELVTEEKEADRGPGAKGGVQSARKHKAE